MNDPAELPVLRAGTERPAHRVDDVAQRLRDLPDFLDADLPDLRLVAAQPEVVERDTGEMALRSFGEHRHLRDEIGARLEVAHRLALAVPSLVARADANDAAVRDEQLLRGRLGQDHRPTFLGALAEPAAELREREDDVAVIAHRGRRRDPERRSTRQHVDGFAVHLAVARHVLDAVAVAKEPAERARIDDGARQQVRAGLLALLDDGNRHLTQLVCDLWMLLEQLAEPDRAR